MNRYAIEWVKKKSESETKFPNPLSPLVTFNTVAGFWIPIWRLLRPRKFIQTSKRIFYDETSTFLWLLPDDVYERLNFPARCPQRWKISDNPNGLAYREKVQYINIHYIYTCTITFHVLRGIVAFTKHPIER